MMTSDIFPCRCIKSIQSYTFIKKGDEIDQIIDQLHFYYQYHLTQLTLYLEDNKIIHCHKYGFRKFHSTEYTAHHISHYEMDVGETTVNVYLVLCKAIDTLVYSTLLYKMKHYGIDGLAYK